MWSIILGASLAFAFQHWLGMAVWLNILICGLCAIVHGFIIDYLHRG